MRGTIWVDLCYFAKRASSVLCITEIYSRNDKSSTKSPSWRAAVMDFCEGVLLSLAFWGVAQLHNQKKALMSGAMHVKVSFGHDLVIGSTSCNN